MRYNDYDDEVERMRSRKSRPAGRQAAGRRPAPEPAHRRGQYREEPEPYYDDAPDGDYEEDGWLDDDYDGAYEGYDENEYSDEGDGLELVNLDDRPSGRPVRNDRPVRKTAAAKTAGRSAQSRQNGRPHSGGQTAGSARNQGKHTSAGASQAPSRQRRAYVEDEDMETNRGGGRQRPAKRKKKRIGKIIRNLILLALVFWVGSLAWAFVHKQTGTWTVAVFGVDSRDGGVGKNALADVQMICTLDRETGEIKLVSVYRDTYLKINSEGTYHKINEAYFKGGHTQAVDALEENLDLSIDNYATFNWKAVADAINILGGVDLEITESEFKYINAFITETVESTGIGSHHLEHAGANHLDGVQAVAYCRLRLMDTDFQRTERQRKVVSLALDKAKQADSKTLVSLVSAVLPQLSTDIGMDDLLPMAKNVSKYHLGETGGFPFSRQSKKIGRMDCVIPTTLESNVSQLHLFLYGKENYKPSSTVQKISQRISEESGLYEEGKPAPTGGSGSGGSSTPQTSPATQPAQTEPAPVETTVEETTAEETLEEATEAETETIEETEPEEQGPGVTPTTSPRETTEGTGESEGPGGADTPSERPTRAPERETTGSASSEAPGGSGSSGNSGSSQGPGGSDTSGQSQTGGQDGPGGPGV